MKILLLNRSYYPHVGGIENSLYCLSRELKRSGNEVTVFTQEVPGKCAEREEFATVIRYPRYSFNKLLCPIIPYLSEKKVIKAIKLHKADLEADVVICRDPMLGLAYSKVFNNAYIVYIPAVIIRYYNKGVRKADNLVGLLKEIIRFLQLKIEERQQKNVMLKSNKVIVFSTNIKNQIARGNICDIAKVSVCYPGVSNKISANLEKSRCEDSTKFLFIGRIVAEKNLEMLIRAFKKLDCKNKKLIIVGDGSDRTYLQKITDELNLGDSVIFTGETAEPQKYYKKADFFVIPSKYESFGQVIAEALTAGVPVIGFKTIEGKTLTAVEELVKDGETGFVCNEFSSDALCDAMRKAANLFTEQENYYHMRNNCSRFAEENFSWRLLADCCIQ